MLEPQDVVDAIGAWAQDVLGANLNTLYDYGTAGKSGQLPDLVVELARVAAVVRPDPERFPPARYQTLHVQQIERVMLYDADCSFMVSNGAEGDAAAAQAGAHTLRAFAGALLHASLSDTTLRGRVPGASLPEFDFVPQFVEYDDGTRGREMRMALTVADPVGR